MYLVQASWWAPEDRLLQKTSTLLQRESWSRIFLASWSGIAGLVLQASIHKYPMVWYWSGTGTSLLLQAYIHKYLMVWYIAAFAMVFSMRRTGTAVTGDLDLPKIIWFWLHFQWGESGSVPISPDLYFQWQMKSNFNLLGCGVVLFKRQNQSWNKITLQH